MQSGQAVKTQAVAGGGSVSKVADTSGGGKQLSEGVAFTAVETLVDSRNALAIQQAGGTVPTTGGSSQGDGSGLSSPLLLYPDGSCTTAQIILQDAKGRRMAIQIRGVTGQLKSMRLASIATP